MGISLKLNSRPIMSDDGEEVARRIVASLSQTGDRALKGVEKVLEEGAEDIADLARAYAPYASPEFGGSRIEREHLQEAIETRRNRGGALEVFVNGRRKGHGGKLIAEYAWLMHEGLIPYGDGPWHASPSTQAKNPYAGGRYLERAFNDMSKKIKDDAERVARKVFGK